MSGFIQYLDNGGKNGSIIIEDDSVVVKYNNIWNKTLKTLSIKINSMPVYHEKYMKANLAEFNGVVNTNFWDDEVPKEGMHCICIAYRRIDSVGCIALV